MTERGGDWDEAVRRGGLSDAAAVGETDTSRAYPDDLRIDKGDGRTVTQRDLLEHDAALDAEAERQLE